MNNVLITPTTFPRTVFLAGLATCPNCSASVRPSAGESSFVRLYASGTGIARCDVCYTTTDYKLESLRQPA